jgi:tetratricopeptide (TPR) repeat protein
MRAVLLGAAILWYGGQAALGQQAADVNPDRRNQLEAIVARLAAQPADRLTVADRLTLSDAYRQLGNSTMAVRAANAAVRAEPKNPDCWVALVKAQIATRHQVVYAEENFRYAARAFADEPKIHDLHEDLFFAQLKYGQPRVAVDHLAAYLKFGAARLATSPENAEAYFNKAEELLRVFETKHVPSALLLQLQQKLRQIEGESPRELAPRFAALLDKLNELIAAETARERSRS